MIQEQTTRDLASMWMQESIMQAKQARQTVQLPAKCASSSEVMIRRESPCTQPETRYKGTTLISDGHELQKIY